MLKERYEDEMSQNGELAVCRRQRRRTASLRDVLALPAVLPPTRRRTPAPRYSPGRGVTQMSIPTFIMALLEPQWVHRAARVIVRSALHVSEAPEGMGGAAVDAFWQPAVKALQ